MRDENTFTGRVHDNERTICIHDTAPPPPAPLGPREAFLAAHERLASVAAAAGGPAVAVAAVDPRARVVDACFVPDRSALVIGRHSECGLRLPGGAISLRHIALLARRGPPDIGPAGSPDPPTGPVPDRMHAHLWDLNTEHPFSTEDGETTSALVSDGPIYLAVAEYSLWIVPADVLASLPDRARAAWEALPPRRFLDRRSPHNPAPPPGLPVTGPEAPPARARAAIGRPAFASEPDVTSVTMCAPALLLQEDEQPEIGWGVLRLAGGGRKARHPVSAERLERGILLGRYDRCGLTIGGLDAVSRVHLLVVRIGDEVWAIDTASTNGVQRRGQPVSAVVLEAQDELRLARSLSVTWTREVHPEA